MIYINADYFFNAENIISVVNLSFICLSNTYIYFIDELMKINGYYILEANL